MAIQVKLEKRATVYVEVGQSASLPGTQTVYGE